MVFQDFIGAMINMKDLYMKDFFIIVFCKFFQFSKFIGNANDDNPYAFKAMCIFTLFLSLNVFTIYAYYKCLIEHSNIILFSKGIEVIIIFLTGAALYYAFLRDKKYELVFEKFKHNSKISGRVGTWITIAYMVATICFLLSVIWLKCSY